MRIPIRENSIFCAGAGYSQVCVWCVGAGDSGRVELVSFRGRLLLEG